VDPPFVFLAPQRNLRAAKPRVKFVHGFAAKAKALACKILPAKQVTAILPSENVSGGLEPGTSQIVMSNENVGLHVHVFTVLNPTSSGYLIPCIFHLF